ncbi:hypothetical protein GCM10010171_60470 [Actinokineospora fastidiosa]|uniref:Uncharacterized protein n=1 Tax=Actinokineospora fastidiosa TaxID=1816 RepID=A0A918GRN3_9PSEU|nr:hypothetical protein GCM10010171_60470 [Actinokineospora fastidiosa]
MLAVWPPRWWLGRRVRVAAVLVVWVLIGGAAVVLVGWALVGGVGVVLVVWVLVGGVAAVLGPGVAVPLRWLPGQRRQRRDRQPAPGRLVPSRVPGGGGGLAAT